MLRVRGQTKKTNRQTNVSLTESPQPGGRKDRSVNQEMTLGQTLHETQYATTCRHRGPGDPGLLYVSGLCAPLISLDGRVTSNMPLLLISNDAYIGLELVSVLHVSYQDIPSCS